MHAAASKQLVAIASKICVKLWADAEKFTSDAQAVQQQQLPESRNTP
jgi:hypothetical protein